MKYGLPSTLRFYFASKGVKPTQDDMVSLVKGWIYHNRFLSRYANSEKDGAISELEKIRSLKPLPVVLEMEYLFDICNLANQFSLWKMMAEPLDRLENLSQQMGHSLGRALAMYLRAALCINEGNYCQAIERYEKALMWTRQAGGDDLEAEILNDIGFCYRRLGDDAKGEYFYKSSLELRDRRKNLQGMAESLNNLGLLYINTEQDDKAGECLNRALELETRIGDKMGMGYTLLNLGYLMNKRKARDDARYLFLHALDIRKEIGDLLGMGYCYLQLAYITDDVEQAVKLAKKAYGCFAQAGDANGQIQACLSQADIHIKAGKTDQALKILSVVSSWIRGDSDGPTRKRLQQLTERARLAMKMNKGKAL